MATAKAYNAGDTKQVVARAKQQKNDRDQQLEDLKQILATAAGVRFFRRFMIAGKIFQTTFTGNSQSFFLEGHRNLALQFFNDICEAVPEKVAEIMIQKEN